MCMYNGRYSVDFPDAHIAVPEAPSSHFFRRKKKKGIHIAVRRGGGATSQMPTWTSPTDPDRIDPMFVMDEGEEDTDDPYPPGRLSLSCSDTCAQTSSNDDRIDMLMPVTPLRSRLPTIRRRVPPAAATNRPAIDPPPSSAPWPSISPRGTTPRRRAPIRGPSTSSNTGSRAARRAPPPPSGSLPKEAVGDATTLRRQGCGYSTHRS